jgi:hypothetical protein
MPDDLNGIYRAILLFVSKSDQEIVRKSLLWLCFAFEPLTLAALSDAVVLEEGDTLLGEEIRLPNPSIILEICQGLIAYDKKTDEVTLAHSTVRAFLIDERGIGEPLEMYHLQPGAAHREIYRKCITYLLLDEFRLPSQSKEHLRKRFSDFPLMRFAAENWPRHFNYWTDTQSKSCKAEIEHILNFFGTRSSTEGGGHYASWIQGMINQVDPEICARSEPLYYSASFGMQLIVKALLELGAPLEARGGRQFSTPLQVACYRGHLNTMKILLEAGADPNSTNQLGIPCIRFARESSGMRELLLQFGANGDTESFTVPVSLKNFSIDRDKHYWTCCVCLSGPIILALHPFCFNCQHSFCSCCEMKKV